MFANLSKKAVYLSAVEGGIEADRRLTDVFDLPNTIDLAIGTRQIGSSNVGASVLVYGEIDNHSIW